MLPNLSADEAQMPAPDQQPTVKHTISIELVHEALLQCALADVDRQDLLEKTGITLLPGGADQRVPASTYAALWSGLAQQTDDWFFGMDPRPLRHGSLAFLFRSSMSQPTVAAGLESGLSFLRLMLEQFDARLILRQSVAEIVISQPASITGRAFADFTFWMVVHGLICWLCGRRVPILGIDLRCAEPGFTDDYRVMFSDNLRFERPHSRMIFAADCLSLPIRRTEQELQAFLAATPGNLLVKYRDAQSLASRIRHALRSRPADQWPQSAALAQELAISASTLRRRLADEGQSYQSLKDGLRRELAMGWLADEALSFASIAERLGFADTSSFYKAFRKWSGTNPGHYRSVVIGQTGHPD
jgi:AraC-like DNA-binding protein